MSELTASQAIEKAYQAETILSLIQEKTVARMGNSEVDVLIVLVRKLIGDVGCYLDDAEDAGHA